MGILSDVKTILDALNIPCETGTMSDLAEDTYCVLVPIAESSLWGDDTIDTNVEECMISLYTKGNYITVKTNIIKALLEGGYTITDRRYIEYESTTHYYHYEIFVEHPYAFAEEEQNNESEEN